MCLVNLMFFSFSPKCLSICVSGWTAITKEIGRDIGTWVVWALIWEKWKDQCVCIIKWSLISMVPLKIFVRAEVDNPRGRSGNLTSELNSETNSVGMDVEPLLLLPVQPSEVTTPGELNLQMRLFVLICLKVEWKHNSGSYGDMALPRWLADNEIQLVFFMIDFHSWEEGLTFST